MAGCLASLLDDVFPQVGFYRLQAGTFQKCIEAGFLSYHGFALGDTPGVVLLADVQHDAVHFLGIDGSLSSNRIQYRGAEEGDLFQYDEVFEVEMQDCRYLQFPEMNQVAGQGPAVETL